MTGIRHIRIRKASVQRRTGQSAKIKPIRVNLRIKILPSSRIIQRTRIIPRIRINLRAKLRRPKKAKINRRTLIKVWKN